eukprot:GHVT01077455.1.p1 GENE.GHVT01077455.1~~GHVT01077455.1.p1  ORF type:complete len:194 (+),score=21.62 GHVT01077455.1:733-1314(+)
MTFSPHFQRQPFRRVCNHVDHLTTGGPPRRILTLAWADLPNRTVDTLHPRLLAIQKNPKDAELRKGFNLGDLIWNNPRFFMNEEHQTPRPAHWSVFQVREVGIRAPTPDDEHEIWAALNDPLWRIPPGADRAEVTSALRMAKHQHAQVEGIYKDMRTAKPTANRVILLLLLLGVLGAVAIFLVEYCRHPKIAN